MDKDKLTELQEKYPGQQLYVDEDGFTWNEEGDIVDVPQWVIEENERVHWKNVERIRNKRGIN